MPEYLRASIKMQASKEVWGKVFGAISTRQKFLNMRLELASMSGAV